MTAKESAGGGSPSSNRSSSNSDAGLTGRRFYALIWKDLVVHKRHYILSFLEITVPLFVCAMAIISNSHAGKARLENERSFDPDDYDRIYGDLTPTRHRLLVAPNTTFTRALINHIDDASLSIELVKNEQELVDLIKAEIPVSLDQLKRLIPDDNQNVTIGGVVINSDYEMTQQPLNNNNININSTRKIYNELDYYEVMNDQERVKMKIPLNFDMSIRSKDFRLGPEPFPKKYSLGPFMHNDHYTSTFFMASQIILSRAYINLLHSLVVNQSIAADATSNLESLLENVIPTNEQIIGQKMPYPKFVSHKRLKESTLGTFVAGSQKQKPFVLTMDYCITVGFLVTAIFLAKRIVDEKKSRVRNMLRLVGISDITYYGSHICNTMIIMSIQCLFITFLFTSHSEAPAQHADISLLFIILLVYSLAAIMFVIMLSTLFTSSTRAIIFTSLAWLTLPEVFDRFFKLNAGVVESNGSIVLPEWVHLLFCVMQPNFALRLMNRLLTEGDIYGEFYEKKQIYGEYRPLWANIFTSLPLYKFITIGYVLGAMLASIVFFAFLIYLIDSLSSPLGGLASLSSESEASSNSSSNIFAKLLNILINLVIGLVLTPFKLLAKLMPGSYQSKQQGENHNQQQAHLTIHDLGHINSSFKSSLQDFKSNQQQQQILSATNLELGHFNNNTTTASGAGNNDSNIMQQQHQQQLQLLGSHPEPTRPEDEALYFERSPRMLQIGISIRNLCKTFYTSSAKMRQIDAVRNVSLDMFYSQILVLLGHNGAGKTTLIDIISGHNTKSSGQIFIDGYSIDTNPSEARKKVGFCPQFDVLFERLTVYEHLYFYGIVKGARSELSREIEDLLAQSGLDKHRNKLSKTLSGGYKRKLSLAIAMIAGSKVLILDEPTSGMDPESRRKVWDFLQLIRHDRLILMTTHHMEEADALGDRIAVMSAGQVKCCGSALFLKRIFNAGYHLRVSKSNTWNQVAFDELINDKHQLDKKLENFTPHELMYSFNASETSTLLPKLFDDLEKFKDRCGIFGFGITVSTMDDVFMKIGLHFKDVEAEEMETKFKMDHAKHQTNAINGGAKSINSASSKLINNLTPVDFNTTRNTISPIHLGASRKDRLEGKKLFYQHVRALLAKRYQHARKNWFQMFWIMGISLTCIISVVVLIDMVIFREELTPGWSRQMTLDGVGYGRDTYAIYQYETEPNPDNLEALRNAAFPITFDNNTSTTTSTSAPTTTTTSTGASVVTALSAATTLGNAVATSESPSATANSFAITTTSPTTPATATTTTTTTITTTTTTESTGQRRRRRRIIRNSNGLKPVAMKLTSGNESEMFFKQYWLPQAQKQGIRDVLTYTDANTEMVDLLTRQFANFREHYIIGGERTRKKYIAWYNGEASHAFPISMNLMLNSVLQRFTDLIKDKGHPLKGSRISLTHVAMSQINTLIAFLPHLGRLINLVFLPFSLAFITSYFVMFPTQERVSKSKHLQLMTGVPTRIFWLSHFIFDFIFYALYTVIVLAIYFIWDRVLNDHRIYFANFEHSIALIALVTLFIFAALPLAYIFSFLAKKPTSAFSSFCVLTILTGTATLTLVSLYELKYENSASWGLQLAFGIFFWSARLVPSVSLLIGLQKLFALNTTRSICINVSPEILDLLCRYISSPLIDDELRVLRPERCCKQVCENECYDQWPFFWTGWFGVNIEIAMLIFDACLLWFILIMIEHRDLRRKLSGYFEFMNVSKKISGLYEKMRGNCWRVPQFACPAAIKELRAEQEKSQRIIEQNLFADHAMVVNQLTKVYPSNNFKAVDQLSFVVDKHEFFGLLGVNGAGKSTTFKMLTGERTATSGNSWIGAYNFETDKREYLKRIGYCPQQDALIDNLTGAQMLALYGRLRGLREENLKLIVDDTLNRLGLTKIKHIDCNKYSGGNKRRLAVGMALIGAPDVIFLDEPTSGVDPRSRRRLWSTLIDFQRETNISIVMTSHSMNECECLCDRVAIMVGGQFRVMGSIQYLRTKLSQGFSLILKLKPDNLRDLKDLNDSNRKIHDYMIEQFSSQSIELKDSHQTILQYHIMPSKELTWSKMLIALEKAKIELDLEDYQITSDASLESIFLELAKQQEKLGHQQQNKK